jgi:hypothetical protein
MPDKSEGGQPGNSNAVKHDLYSDREKLFDRLTDEEQRLVVEIATDLLEKVDGEVGAYEREVIRNIALDTVKRIRANSYIISEDLIEDGSESADRVNMAYSRLVRDMTKEMEKVGLLEDGPAMKSAEAQENWMSAIADAKDSVDE